MSFSGFLAAKCVSLNEEKCMVRPTLIDLTPLELKYYPFMISLNKCTGSCNALSPKRFVSKEAKDINVKALNMITNKNEVKTMEKIFHLTLNAKSIVRHVIQMKTWIIKHVKVHVRNVNVKNVKSVNVKSLKESLTRRFNWK